jgi:hypothetical protein
MAQVPLAHYATLLDVFVAGSHAIFSTHSSKTADLLFVLEEHSLFTIPSTSKNEINIVLTLQSELAAFVWANLVTSTDLAAG